MKISYVSHSSFLVELDTCSLLFDYEKGELSVNEAKPLYVFVSHRHWDHFGKELFRTCERWDNVRYILSDDIKLGPRRRAALGVTDAVWERISFIGPEETKEIGEVNVSTLRSTDQGVAFLVRVGGYTLFHAGDLNWWLWGQEDTPQEAQEMTERFQREVAKLAGTAVDVAFLPLDARQSAEQYWLGLDWYARHMEVQRIFPMHFWKDYAVIERFKALPQAAPYAHKIMEITEEGQCYDL